MAPIMRLLIFILAVVCSVRGHGRLIEPPSRASMWRYGFNTPPNYNDHELYCGGYSRQWSRNGGRCGVCGDAFDTPTPRPHEQGGKYGQGVITRRYSPGSNITVRIELTANHRGHFEFRICQQEKPGSVIEVTQECLDQNLLQRSDGRGARFYPGDLGNKVMEMRYTLPAKLECDQCVFQWRYVAGNNWGQCANGTGAVGCGPQEEFRACSDVSIGQGAAPPVLPPLVQPTRRPYVPPPARTSTDRGVYSTAVPIDGDQDENVVKDVGSSWWVVLLIAALTLLFIVTAFALFYWYFYHAGDRIKKVLKPGAWKSTSTSSPSTPSLKFPSPQVPPALQSNSISALKEVQSLPPNLPQSSPPAMPPVPPRRVKRQSSSGDGNFV